MKTVKRSLPWRAAAATALCFCLLTPGARAASILIDAGNIEELVTFTFSQFEGGFSINGSTPTSGGSFTFGEGTQLNFTGQWIDLGQATGFSRTVYWVEPQAPTVISEILQWTVTPSGASGLATSFTPGIAASSSDRTEPVRITGAGRTSLTTQGSVPSSPARVDGPGGLPAMIDRASPRGTSRRKRPFSSVRVIRSPSFTAV